MKKEYKCFLLFSIDNRGQSLTDTVARLNSAIDFFAAQEVVALSVTPFLVVFVCKKKIDLGIFSREAFDVFRTFSKSLLVEAEFGLEMVGGANRIFFLPDLTGTTEFYEQLNQMNWGEVNSMAGG